jgi:hypothetical protein
MIGVDELRKANVILEVPRRARAEGIPSET